MTARLLCALLLLAALASRAQAQASQAESDRANDAVGFDSSPSSTSPEEPGAAATLDSSLDVSDAVGFSDSASSPASQAVEGDEEPAQSVERTPRPHISFKLRERAGMWLKHKRPSRLAQLRSSAEASITHALPFRMGKQPASLRSALAGRVEYDLAYRVAREQYDRATIDAYELRFVGLESFLGLQVGGVELRSGRLLNPLGQGELWSCIDVLNPRDLRQLGLTDWDSMRLPTWTSRLSITHKAHRLEGIVVHESYFGMFPPLLGRFSPARKLLVDDRLAGDELADRSWRIHHVPGRLDPQATQALARYTFTGHRFDAELYAGSVLDQIGVARLPLPAQLERRRVTLDVYHPRYTLVAHSGSRPIGDFLLRWEASAMLDRAQAVRNTRFVSPVIEVERHTQLNGLLGLTYFGIENGNLGAEVMQSYVLDNPSRKRGSERELLWPVEATSFALRYQHQLFRERLQLGAVGMLVGVDPFNGALGEAQVGYQLRDGVLLRLDYVHYQPSRHFGVFYGFDKNDRLDLVLSWAIAAL